MNTNEVRKWQYEPQRTSEEQRKVVIRVKKKGWLTVGEKVLYSLFASVIIIAGMYVVSFSSKMDSLNRDVQALEANVQEQTLENKSLEFEVRELSKPERIIAIAKEKGLKIQDAKVLQASKEVQ